MSRITAILPAAGLGTRMGAETPKQFLELEGVPIVMLSLRRIASCELITDIIVATRGDGIARLEEQIRAEKFKQTVRVVRGGDARQDSVARALQEVADDTDLVVVHDAVRPFVTISTENPSPRRWCASSSATSTSSSTIRIFSLITANQNADLRVSENSGASLHRS